jgi:hypothetical protein
MKNLRILGGVIAAAFMLLLFTSCSKNVEDLNAKGDKTVNKLDGLDCTPPYCTGDYINMISHNMEKGFFWIGGKNDKPKNVSLDCKQNFCEDLSACKHFFLFSGEGGFPKHQPWSGAIGIVSPEEKPVNNAYINPGEKLILTLSPCLTGFKMKGFDLTLHGGVGTSGVFELYNGETKVKEVAYVSGPKPPNPPRTKILGEYNFGFSFQTNSPNEYFDRVVFKPIVNRIHWIGYQRNLVLNTPFGEPYPYYEGTRFHLVAPN